MNKVSDEAEAERTVDRTQARILELESMGDRLGGTHRKGGPVDSLIANMGHGDEFNSPLT